MTDGTVKERLTEAAFTLFDENGFENTTVSDIAERAGVGRATVFRSFPSKEDLIFPDHERLLAAVQERLATASRSSLEIAVVEALSIVLRHYTAEGARARMRYRLTRSVPALAEREATSVRLYQKAFSLFFQTVLAGERDAELRAELIGAGVVTAHNHVLRRWLRGDTAVPEQELGTAIGYALIGVHDPSDVEAESSIVLVRTAKPIDEVLHSLHRILGTDDVRAVPAEPTLPRGRPRS